MFDLFKRKPPVEESEKQSWSERLKSGLGQSREKLAGALNSVFSRKTLDEATLDELETALIAADVGMPATLQLIEDVRARWKPLREFREWGHHHRTPLLRQAR